MPADRTSAQRPDELCDWFVAQGWMTTAERGRAGSGLALPEKFGERVLAKTGPGQFRTAVEGLTATPVIPGKSYPEPPPPLRLRGGPYPYKLMPGAGRYPPVFLYDSCVGKIFLAVHRTTLILDERHYFEGVSSPDSSWIAPAFANAPGELSLPGTAAILFAHGATLYSHWMFDLLPKLEVLRLAGWTHDKIDYFVVNSFHPGFQTETLERLGVPSEKVVVANGMVVRAPRLLMTSPVRKGLRTPPWVIDFIRHLFDVPASPSTIGPNGLKAYISRAHARRRRIENETEIAAILERRGFETIFAENITVARMADLMAGCSQIVSPHGAGAMNVVFAPQSVASTEIYGAHISPEAWLMTAGIGGKHFLLAARDGQGRYPWENGAYEGMSQLQCNHADYRVDAGDLENALDVMDSGTAAG